jgi:hypothetical protein
MMMQLLPQATPFLNTVSEKTPLPQTTVQSRQGALFIEKTEGKFTRVNNANFWDKSSRYLKNMAERFRVPIETPNDQIAMGLLLGQMTCPESKNLRYVLDFDGRLFYTLKNHPDMAPTPIGYKTLEELNRKIDSFNLDFANPRTAHPNQLETYRRNTFLQNTQYLHTSYACGNRQKSSYDIPDFKDVLKSVRFMFNLHKPKGSFAQLVNFINQYHSRERDMELHAMNHKFIEPAQDFVQDATRKSNKDLISEYPEAAMLIRRIRKDLPLFEALRDAEIKTPPAKPAQPDA